MKTLADEIYLSEALDALHRCENERDIVAFDDKFCSNEAYIHLPSDMIDRLETAYQQRVAYILGGLA